MFIQNKHQCTNLLASIKKLILRQKNVRQTFHFYHCITVFYILFRTCIISDRVVLRVMLNEMLSAINNNRSLLFMVKRKRINNAEDEAANQYMGKQLFIMRRKLGKSQEAMAELFDVSLSSYKRWEIEGPKSYPLSFWNVYSSLTETTADSTMREYHKDAFSFVTSIFKKINRGAAS